MTEDTFELVVLITVGDITNNLTEYYVVRLGGEMAEEFTELMEGIDAKNMDRNAERIKQILLPFLKSSYHDTVDYHITLRKSEIR